MTTKLRKLLALCLAIIMCVGMIPSLTVSAAGTLREPIEKHFDASGSITLPTRLVHLAKMPEEDCLSTPLVNLLLFGYNGSRLK